MNNSVQDIPMGGARNPAMIARIQATPVKYPFCFTIAGDTAASPNPVGDVIFTGLLDQMERLNPKPLFFANLGDFCGPGSLDRHEHYLRLVERLTIPNLCLIGNHDRDAPIGWDNFARVHGPFNFQFAYGHTRFIAINCHSGTNGPREEDVGYLEEQLREDDHRHRIILMHMPPNLHNHYAPHPEWGFAKLESEFLAILKRYGVKLVCCAHVLAYDHHLHEDIAYVVTGGGGWGLCSHYGTCTRLEMGTPPHRGSFYHFVAITVQGSGAISGAVIRAFDCVQADPAYSFGETKEGSHA